LAGRLRGKLPKWNRFYGRIAITERWHWVTRSNQIRVGGGQKFEGSKLRYSVPGPTREKSEKMILQELRKEAHFQETVRGQENSKSTRKRRDAKLQ